MSHRPARRIFNDLPMEIMDEVFTVLLAMLSGGGDRWWQFVALREALCLICSQWRDVVFNSTRHWTTFGLCRSSNLSSVAEQLSRARQSSMTVMLYLGGDPSPPYYPVRTFDELVCYAGQRRVMNLTEEEFRSRVPPLLADIFPQIISLEVVGEEADPLRQFLEQLSCYPTISLHRAIIRLPGDHCNDLPMFRSFNLWHSLRDLAIKSVLQLNSTSKPSFLTYLSVQSCPSPATALCIAA